MKNMIRSSIFALTVLVSVAGAQQLPAIRPLGPVLSTSVEPMASVSQVRALPGGRVLVHDNAGRRVLLYDSTFKKFTVIADTTSATGNAYGSRLGGLISARGDTTLFVDPQSISMLVIDGSGKIVRTMAAPQPNQVNALIGGPNGTPGVDPLGRLVFRAQIQPVFAQGRGAPGAGPAGFVMPTLPESSLVMRVDLKSRKVDTVASFRIPKIMMNVTRDDNTGSIRMTSTVNPIPWTDDWALLADGSVAIIRGQDYRVDLIGPDGKMTTGSKLAFEWQRLSDEDKMKIIDSTRTALEKQRAAQMAAMTAGTGGDAKAGGTAGAAGGGAEAKAAGAAAEAGARQRPQADGGGGMTIMMAGGPGGPGGRGAASFTMPPLEFVSIDQMPDYRPAFRQGAARGDADGNLWIRTSQSVNGGTVYNVISNKGELKDRILIPPGRVVAGFGTGGVVYMGVVDGDITHLERARVPVMAAGAGNNR
jgi:hypothetical protein